MAQFQEAQDAVSATVRRATEQARTHDKIAAAEYAKVAYASQKLDKWVPAPARAVVLKLIETVFQAGVRWERAVADLEQRREQQTKEGGSGNKDQDQSQD